MKLNATYRHIFFVHLFHCFPRHPPVEIRIYHNAPLDFFIFCAYFVLWSTQWPGKQSSKCYGPVVGWWSMGAQKVLAGMLELSDICRSPAAMKVIFSLDKNKLDGCRCDRTNYSYQLFVLPSPLCFWRWSLPIFSILYRAFSLSLSLF